MGADVPLATARGTPRCAREGPTNPSRLVIDFITQLDDLPN